MRTILSSSLVALGLTLSSAASAYHFTTIDHPASAGLTYALSINDHGDVGGTYLGFDGAFHGYVLSGGAYHALDVPGALGTICGSVENSGRVTGTYFDGQGYQHGFQWRDGSFVSIDVPGAGQHLDIEYEFGPGLGTAAVRTDNNTTIGWYADLEGALHGFKEEKGAFQTIDVPGGFLGFPGYGTQPIALNSRGAIGGSYALPTSPPIHGFVLDHGVFTTIDAPGVGGSFGTQVNGMNSRGDLAGPYTSPDDVLHGFVIHHGVFTTVDVPGAPFSEVDSISENGAIAGEWYDFDGSIHAYLATP